MMVQIMRIKAKTYCRLLNIERKRSV